MCNSSFFEGKNGVKGRSPFKNTRCDGRSRNVIKLRYFLTKKFPFPDLIRPPATFSFRRMHKQLAYSPPRRGRCHEVTGGGLARVNFIA